VKAEENAIHQFAKQSKRLTKKAINVTKVKAASIIRKAKQDR